MRLLVQLAGQYISSRIPLRKTFNLSFPPSVCDVEQITGTLAYELSPFKLERLFAEDQAPDRMANGFGANVTNNGSFMAFTIVGL